VREADPVAVELEDAAALRPLDVVDRLGRERFQQRHRGSAEGRDGDERVSHTPRQRVEARCDNALQALGEGHRPAVRHDRAVRQRAPELERVERVAAGGLVHAHERGPRQVQRQSPPEHPVNRADGERPYGKALERSERAVELERRADRSPAHRCENADRFTLEPPEHERENLGRARVDPLHVVEREQHRPLPSERAHDRDECESEHAHLGRRPVGFTQEQCDLQRAPLD